MTLNITKVSAPYYRRNDGGYINNIPKDSIVDNTGWVQGNMTYIKLGMLTGDVWIADGRTGWIESVHLAPYTITPPDDDTIYDEILVKAHWVEVVIGGTTYDYSVPDVVMSKV